MSRTALDTNTDGVPVPDGDPVELRAVADQIGATHPHVQRDEWDEQTAGYCRAALLELADVVDGEDKHPVSAPFSPVLRRIVPALVPTAVRSDLDGAMHMFDQLVGAVAERGRFLAGETDYCATHDWATTDVGVQMMDERLQADVDHWLDCLLGKRWVR